MPYDLQLEKRIDRAAERLGNFEKKKMFGGVGYMLHGNMAFGIHKEWLLVRTSPEVADQLLKKGSVRIFDMTGRPMKGWLLVSPQAVKTEKQLGDWLKRSIDYVKTLPEK